MGKDRDRLKAACEKLKKLSAEHNIPIILAKAPPENRDQAFQRSGQGTFDRIVFSSQYMQNPGRSVFTHRIEGEHKLFELKNQGETGGAVFSKCETWRYKLWRQWAEDGKWVAFIGLNPSTADAKTNDPTVIRCIRFAKRWGYGGMYMLNLFALRSTDPKVLYQHDDPIGPDNDEVIVGTIYAQNVHEVVLCWGNHGKHLNRWKAGWDFARSAPGDKMRWFGLTKEKQPKHPLYLPKTAELEKGR